MLLSSFVDLFRQVNLRRMAFIVCNILRRAPPHPHKYSLGCYIISRVYVLTHLQISREWWPLHNSYQGNAQS